MESFWYTKISADAPLLSAPVGAQFGGVFDTPEHTFGMMVGGESAWNGGAGCVQVFCSPKHGLAEIEYPGFERVNSVLRLCTTRILLIWLHLHETRPINRTPRLAKFMKTQGVDRNITGPTRLWNSQNAKIRTIGGRGING
jgi:hypothetical protein